MNLDSFNILPVLIKGTVTICLKSQFIKWAILADGGIVLILTFNKPVNLNFKDF